MKDALSRFRLTEALKIVVDFWLFWLYNIRMKLTKTQKYLLETALTYDGKYSITTSYGHGPKGGRRFFGMRERDALLKLEELGLVEITSREPWQDYNNGWKQSGNTLAFRLTTKEAK
jgi:hypothetical protein